MFFETARGRKNAVESDWDSKISPKNWVLKKIDGFLDTKYWNLSKPLKVKCRKFAVESDWDSKISQKNWVVKNRWVSWHKILKSFKTA